jgi:hypothetical protein
MDKHREQVLEQQVSSIAVRFFRPLALLLLGFTTYLSVELFGGSIGPVVLFGAMTIATLILIVTLTYRAKIIPQLVILFLIIASGSILSS